MAAPADSCWPRSSGSIRVTPLLGTAVEDLPVEIVERKGLGHPDTLCDHAVEAFSRALCREYLDRTGAIQHHNVDKGVLCAGRSRAGYGGGAVELPLRMVHAGRATTVIDGVSLDVDELAATATREHFSRALRYLDADRHLQVETRVQPTSADLAALFARASGVPLANDTSIGCGYAPLSGVERLVLEIERFLTAPETLTALPFLGEDVKVMGVREDDAVTLTVAAALVADHVPGRGAYADAKARLVELVQNQARSRMDRPVAVSVNAGDDVERDQVYLTVVGTSAEAGDDGQVGRGNRVNGLITPARPMTLEAAAGKNPISHVGKLYNLWAHRTAERLTQLPGIDAVVLQLVSRIGAPITEPQVVWLQVGGPAGRDAASLQRIVRDELETLPRLWQDVIAGTLAVA